ncbi:methionine ABC transporter substrate-binding protein [Suicoccus acidiformans]|uniref:Methionine ABC transporter substrate-binding protein n=1 Tax=Suicoccus acidiformans TaxID=2036206 RepID=A0A347WHP3_9LACT|nr:MetQ/NlpA family ABC transporter substrate-binding protein [Suicoccus acidiformans]AXY24600.1 methionine ABC transporter substrate-binding protein [Suicoccus acidiformans]
MKQWIKKLSVAVLAGALTLPSALPVLASEAGSFEGETVKIGVVSGPEEDVWQVVVDKAAEEGITVELELFTDYVQPNVALQDGSIDLNAFQHVAFLEDWNASNDGTLEPIGYTFVSPMGAYSDSITSLDELEDGDQVAIPNDPTNGGRAILALELAGVIEVDDAAGALATVDDITDNPKNINIVELEAAQLSAAIPDSKATFINTNFATDAGLSLADAIFVDADYPDELNESYKNVIAARSEDVENPLYQRIVEIYQTEEVAQAIYDSTNGGDKAIWEGAPVIEGPASADVAEEADVNSEEAEADEESSEETSN